MRDFPAFISCLISRCRLCLFPTCSPRLPPGKLTCFPSLTSCSASAFLVFVCSAGNDSSAWLWLSSRLLLVGASASVDCSSGFETPACLRPLLRSLLDGTSARSAVSPSYGAFSSSSAVEVSYFSLLTERELNCFKLRSQEFLLCSTAGFGFIPSFLLSHRDIVRAHSPKNGLYFEYSHSASYLVCCGDNKGNYELFPFSGVLHLGPKHTRFSTIGPEMDPADPASPQSRLARVEGLLKQHEAQLASNAVEARQSASALERALTSLATQVQQMAASMNQHAASASVPAPPAPIPGPSTSTTFEPRVGAPERYAGDPEGCSPFLTNCSILFALQPHTFATEGAKVAFTINHLTGRARLWGTAEWERGTPACTSFQAFAEELRKVFGPVSLGPDVTGGLMSLRQGDRTVADYAIDFRTRARLSDWNAAAQCDAFLNGLAPYVKDELVSFDLPNSLDGLIELTTRLDRRIQARRRELRLEGRDHRSSARQRGFPAVPVPLPETTHGEAEPMQVGRTSLTPEERERRRRGNLCLYCGQAGHFVSRCPVKGRAQQ